MHKNSLQTRNIQTKIENIDPSTIVFVEDKDIKDPKFICTNPETIKILNEAKDLLCLNEVVAIPTETVYGLASNALSPISIKKIFQAKNRPLDNPLIIHISSLKMLYDLLSPTSTSNTNNATTTSTITTDSFTLSPLYDVLMKKFWPGPLTLLFPKTDKIPDEITCGQDKVAIRFPSNNIARALITLCGFPLAAPSANSSGKPSPTLANHVYNDLNNRIPLIIDGGQCDFGLESTVLDITKLITDKIYEKEDETTTKYPVILRPGGITFEQLVRVPGLEHLKVYKKDFIDENLEMKPTTPGMKYRHYSPDAKVILIDVTIKNGGDDDKVRNIIKPFQKNGFTYYNNERNENDEIIEYSLGDLIHPHQIAKELFKGLRYLDEKKVDYIIAQSMPEIEEGLAVMNRLRKAASKIIND
ncbi:5643_t:CDS:2 [Entrophospora sp. SA101]|nr:12867_t:CDS:2 [Entrophospora sp. SA101]CAJ0638466.1 3041_t:CDS:2 [Entrophospora sp. SA101]CAJ0748554.1 5643_t:CDS:2 [Entrophospora sp. SA101]CAJ0830479.1 2585_t:CDS:2 [Entrophospora sp. SA101]CAJ0830595.1 9742_t:CDS:2 [Entrophospora sp. SA101]